MNYRVALIYLTFIISLSSCTGFRNNFIRPKNQPYIQINSGEALEKYTLEKYTVQPRDLLAVNLNSPDASTNIYFNRSGATGVTANQPNPTTLYLSGYLVSDSGYVNLPMIGKYHAVGKTIEEIEKGIYTELTKYLREFSVSVKLSNFRVTVLGEVRRPGTLYFYESKVTLLQALSMAGDFDEYANRSKVRIIREFSDKTETYELNLQEGGFLSSQQFLLRTGDVIYIEPLKSKVFSLNRNVLTIILSSITAALTLYRIIQTQ